MSNSDEEESGVPGKDPEEGQHLALWMAIGVALGAGLGVAFRNIAIGVGIGLALGAGVGIMLDAKKKGRK